MNIHGSPHVAASTRTAAAAALIVGTAALGGCAIVSSVPEASDVARKGFVYRMPKALVPIELVDTGSDLSLRVLTPEIIGDPRQTYLLDVPSSGLSSDKTVITVDPKTGLLKSINATGTDETLNVLKELIVTRVGGRRAELGAAGGSDQPVVLFRADFDPDAAFDAGAAARNRCTLARMQRAVARRVAAAAVAAASQSVPPAASASGGSSASSALAASATRAADQTPGPASAATINLRFRVESSVPPNDAVKPSEDPCSASAAAAVAPAPRPSGTADCSIGICHRGVRAFRLELGVGGDFDREITMMLPNGAEPVALPIERAAFVTTKHTVEFESGMLKSHDLDRPSSALALVKWPLDVYKAVLDATSTLITLRIGANDNEVKLRESQLKTEKELDRLQRELDEFRNNKDLKGELGAGDRSASPAGVVMALPLNVGPSAAARQAAAVAAGRTPGADPKPPTVPASGGGGCQPGQACTAPGG